MRDFLRFIFFFPIRYIAIIETGQIICVDAGGCPVFCGSMKMVDGRAMEVSVDRKTKINMSGGKISYIFGRIKKKRNFR